MCECAVGVAGARRPGAFTLLEVVLVLAIVTTLGAIAAPRYARYTLRYRADLAVGRVISDLNLARLSAKASGGTRAVTFDVGTSRYQVQGWSSLNNRSNPYWVNLSDMPYEARLISASFGGTSQITYGGWGLPQAGGTAILAVGPEQRTITVDLETGQATIQ